ncbi:MAG: gene transfer agent family protein [Alphaproteobacteria bacterium]|nr:MAG: gene transfer agent family protein [Alphaproteobacteria bacterium]
MPTGTIDLDFGDAKYPFCIAKHAQIFELQDKCADREGPSGPLKILRRLSDNSWTLQDVRETIRLGLIGGGMPPPDALKLVRRYLDDPDAQEWQPWAHSVPIARAVLFAAAVGVPSDPLGEAKGERTETEEPKTGSSSAPGSTASPRRSASRRAKRTK